MPALSSLARGSVLVRTASHATGRLRTAFHASRVGSVVHGVLLPVRSFLERSGRTEMDPRSARDAPAIRSLRGSTLAAVGRHVDARFRSAAAESVLRRTASTSVAVARSSWLYRWLTTEPEPDVVVIDLRKTWSVGPPLAVIDRTVDAIVPGVEGATVVEAIERTGDALRRRPVAIASAIVLCAVAFGLLLTLLRGDPTRTTLFGQLVVAALAAVGLRSRATLADLRETRLARTLVAVLEPPEPPAERTDRSPGGQRSADSDESDESVAPEADEYPDDGER
ncbi:hypothetical protein GCM10028857_29260 [Salinarchaeum chitinilyticum]